MWAIITAGVLALSSCATEKVKPSLPLPQFFQLYWEVVGLEYS